MSDNLEDRLSLGRSEYWRRRQPKIAALFFQSIFLICILATFLTPIFPDQMDKIASSIPYVRNREQFSVYLSGQDYIPVAGAAAWAMSLYIGYIFLTVMLCFEALILSLCPSQWRPLLSKGNSSGGFAIAIFLVFAFGHYIVFRGSSIGDLGHSEVEILRTPLIWFGMQILMEVLFFFTASLIIPMVVFKVGRIFFLAWR